MRFSPLYLIFLCLAFTVRAQDTTYARNMITNLCSKKCFGRGYVKGGLQAAGKIILSEIKTAGADPFFGKSYTSSFIHPVNTFPGACSVKLNGKPLSPGTDFIPSPDCPPLKGKFKLQKKDSITYSNGEGLVTIKLRKKLTFSVAGRQDKTTEIELDAARFSEIPEELEIRLKSRLNAGFKSQNIACYIRGTMHDDSLVVFSAHYDHLGGIGKRTYFPGANDNASGVSMLLDLIRFYKTHPPAYRTLFIFFAGEEAGLLGSKAFVNENKDLTGKIKFLVNLDLLGTGDDGIMVVNGAIHEKAFNSLLQINEREQLVKQIKKRGKAANSDHYWFTEAGVPAFFIYTMGGRSAYHDVYDTAAGLPLTDYSDVFKLITGFVAGL